MTVYEIRLENVLKIIDTKCNGVKAQLGRKIGVIPQTLARWWAKKNRRNIGSNAARRIETAFSLSEGWLDVSHIDNSDLESNYDKKQTLRVKSGNAYIIHLKRTATLDEQKLQLHLLQNVKGHLMLLSTDKDAWSIQLIGTHPNPILSHGWGFIVEPNAKITEQEYALIKLKNGELLLRLITYIGDDGMIITKNPITGHQEHYHKQQIASAEYCYIGIPPSKITLEQ